MLLPPYIVESEAMWSILLLKRKRACFPLPTSSAPLSSRRVFVPHWATGSCSLIIYWYNTCFHIAISVEPCNGWISLLFQSTFGANMEGYSRPFSADMFAGAYHAPLLLLDTWRHLWSAFALYLSLHKAAWLEDVGKVPTDVGSLLQCGFIPWRETYIWNCPVRAKTPVLKNSRLPRR